MDTDSLTRDAYRVLIARSGEISEFLRAENGAAASRYPNEESYLGVMHQFVWNLLDEVDPDEFGSRHAKLADEIMGVIRTPIEKRGPVGE